MAKKFDGTGISKSMQEELNEMKNLAKNSKMSNITDMQDSGKYKYLNRFKLADGQDYLSSGIAYVFFTRPHLNLKVHKGTSDDVISDPFLLQISMAPESTPAGKIATSLDGMNGTKDTSKFLWLLTNSAESFETKDTVLKTKEIYGGYLGDKLVWGDTTIESTGGDTFTVEYTEYSDMSLTLLHKVWVDYIHAVKINKIHPYRSTNGNKDKDYVHSKIVDYASSVFYFLLEADGTTIRYFAKYTGVFPTNVPYSALSYKLGENSVKKLSINYQYSFKEDLNPDILDEFAWLTGERLTKNKVDAQKDPVFNAHNTFHKSVRLSDDHKKLVFINPL